MYVCNWIGMLLNTDTAPLSHPNIVNSTGVNKDEIDLRIIKSPDICFFPLHCTEVHFASFLSGGFITAIVVNPPERKLAKRISVHCLWFVTV